MTTVIKIYDWKDKTVLVTGGARGIGAELIRKITEEGVKYIAFLDILESQALALKEELNEKRGKQIVHFYKCDVSDEDQIAKVFSSVVKECGYIDVVVNNAGICNDSVEMFRKEVNINYTGLVSLSLKALALMRKDEGGRGGTIVNVASIAALQHVPLFPIYAGSKAAVLQFSRSLAMDEYYKRTEVRVIVICFGATQTPILDKENFGSFDKMFDTHLTEMIAPIPRQTAESAAAGLSEAYKRGENASAWLVSDGNAKDITETVSQAYALLSTVL